MRGTLTLVFDDGYEAVYQCVVPLFNKLRLRGVFALPLNTSAFQKTVAVPVRPWQKWLDVKSSGHEIAAHSITHVDLRTLDTSALERELKLPHDCLGATTLVYPGGVANDDIAAAVKKYYTAARTTRYGFEAVPPVNPWQLTSVDYTKDNFSLLAANARVLWAWITNSWLIETYHVVNPARDGVDTTSSKVHHSVPFADFERHVEFITRLPIAVRTINEVIRDSHH